MADSTVLYTAIRDALWDADWYSSDKYADSERLATAILAQLEANGLTVIPSAEVDHVRQDSEKLNRMGWSLAVALDWTLQDGHYEGDPEAMLAELLPDGAQYRRVTLQGQPVRGSIGVVFDEPPVVDPPDHLQKRYVSAWQDTDEEFAL